MAGLPTSAPDPGVRLALWGLAWLAGVGLQLQQPALWPAAAVASIAGASAMLGLLGLLASRRGPGWMASLLLAAALAAAGFAGTTLRAAALLAERLPPALEGQDLQITGVVASLPRVGAQGTRFVFEVEDVRGADRPLHLLTARFPVRLSLGWYRGFGTEAGDTAGGPPPDLRAGQRWRFTVRLRQPHGSFNPGGFDLELWLFEQGIRAGGTVRERGAAAPRLLAEGVAHPVERARQTLRDAIFRSVPDATAAGVLAALVVGDQAAIEREDWDLFRTTGVAHLMSISGLHVTMFAWLAAAMVGALWRRSPWLMHRAATPLAARWGGLLLAAAYALLAGWGVPAQRTVWMLALVAALRSAGLRWPLPLVLLVAAVGVTVFDPWALTQPGFWLSFMAVGLLVASEPAAGAPGDAAAPVGWRERAQRTLAGGLRTQVVATVGLAPLSMLFFQQLSIVGFVANLLAIPLVTLLVTPLGLLGVLVPGLWPLAAALMQALMAALQALAGWPLAVWTAAAAAPWAVACGLLAALLAVLPLPWRLRACSLPLMLPLLLPAVPRPAEGQFELIAADVGQGTAVLVRTRQHLLLYDAGPAYSPEADAGGRVLLPLLRVRGERRVDLLMLSHRDSDHVGGAASLLAGVPVAQISSSLRDEHPLLAQAAARGVPHRRCEAGQAWTWDGVRFELLHPLPADHATATKSNALSCVLRVQAGRSEGQGEGGGGRSALLTGDIEAPQEASLLQRDAAALASDWLLVPHHGSRTSSTPDFLDAVAPRTALAQAAYRSRFGHPAADVEQRYTERGIEFLRSDRCGAWTWPVAGPPRCEREAGRRYWHHPGPEEARSAERP